MAEAKIPRQTLHIKTLELLQNRSVKLTLKQISEDTNIDEAWLSLFNRDGINDPSVNKIQYLFEYLTKQILPI